MLQGGNPNDVALHFLAKTIHFQHEVEDLIPGYRFIQGQGDFSGDVFINGKIFTADLPDDSKNIFNVGIVKIKGDGFPRCIVWQRWQQKGQPVPLQPE